MVKLNKIILERLEGYPEKQEAHTFTFADCVLYDWSNTAPEKGYDKVRVILEYKNGDNLTFRYDLKKHDNPSLSSFIKQGLEFYIGLKRPIWMTDKQYTEFLQVYTTPEQREKFKNILNTYQLSD
jgi:hypothetical protein